MLIWAPYVRRRESLPSLLPFNSDCTNLLLFAYCVNSQFLMSVCGEFENRWFSSKFYILNAWIWILLKRFNCLLCISEIRWLENVDSVQLDWQSIIMSANLNTRFVHLASMQSLFCRELSLKSLTASLEMQTKMHPGPARGSWPDWRVKAYSLQRIKREEKDESIPAVRFIALKMLHATKQTDFRHNNQRARCLNNDAFVWDRMIQVYLGLH